MIRKSSTLDDLEGLLGTG